ncbi:ABC transporter substrate-binding protein [Dysosmobacter sp. Marseille-Q4140]|nr:ABC transporter substrate-binding protein [Dysosmobacter sp. Marseille-Q4140]
MKKMKRFASLLLTAMMLLTLVACGGENTTTESSDGDTENSDDVIVLGCYQPLTGNNAIQGEGAKNSVDLYVKELNAKGGWFGKQIKVVHYDDGADPEEAVKCVTKLIESDKIDLCVGSIISSCLLASGAALNENEIPTMGTGLSPTWMAEGWDYFFRACLNTAYSIPSLIETMDQLGFESVAIFEGQDDYGVSAGKSMREACEAAGKTVTTTENYVTGDTDFSGQIAKIINTDPDCVFLGVLSGDAGNIIKQFRQFGYNGIIFYSETLTQDVINVAGDAVNHVIFKYPYITYQDAEDCTDPFMKEFLEKYEAEYGFLPKGDATYRGWDAMIVLDAAVQAAGSTDGAAVREALLNLSDVQGLAGTFDFTVTGDGEGLHDFASWVVVDGDSIKLDDWFGSDDYNAYAAEQGW